MFCQLTQLSSFNKCFFPFFFLKLCWGLRVNKSEDQRFLNASLEIILSGTVIGATESLNVQTDLTKQAAQIVRDSQPF